MRQTERYFAGIEDGYMLPHAVDDRCTVIGTWWSGAIDNASAAWMSQILPELMSLKKFYTLMWQGIKKIKQTDPRKLVY